MRCSLGPLLFLCMFLLHFVVCSERPIHLLQVVPDAFRVTRLKQGRRFCVLGRISDEIGWKHKDAVEQLEKSRKERGALYWAAKKATIQKTKKAKAATASSTFGKTLATFGY